MPRATRGKDYTSVTAHQNSKDRAIALLNDQWPAITPPRTMASRGIDNASGTEDYILSVLQALFHIPKFIAWIQTHNISPTHNPCNPGPGGWQFFMRNLAAIPRPPIAMPFAHAMRIPCVACSMKELIAYYWGNGGLHPTGEPQHMFAHVNPTMIRPIAALGNIATLGQTGIGPGAQDPLVFYDLLLRACALSTDPYSPHTRPEYMRTLGALFSYDLRITTDSPACGHSVAPIYTFSAITVDLKPSDTKDTVKNALARHFEPYAIPNVACANCGLVGQSKYKLELFSAPEILRIALDLDPPPGGQKKMDKVTIAQKLSLSQFAVNDPDIAAPPSGFQNKLGGPLVYRLSSVISHEGVAAQFPRGGQYMTTVKGPSHVNEIMDHNVVQKNPVKPERNPDLNQNPKRHAGADYQAYILTYVRDRSAT